MNQILLANAGVPMIFLALPMMVVLIIPVILLEIWSSRKLITQEKSGKVWLGITVANVFSTFIGWPVAWVLLVVVQMVCGGGGAYGLDSPLGIFLSVTLQAPWLIPYESQLYWMMPVAMGVLLIPFFFVSVYSERFILRIMWKKEDKKEVVRFSWKSHVYSYAFLFLVVIGYSTYFINQHQNIRPYGQDSSTTAAVSSAYTDGFEVVVIELTEDGVPVAARSLPLGEAETILANSEKLMTALVTDPKEVARLLELDADSTENFTVLVTADLDDDGRQHVWVSFHYGNRTLWYKYKYQELKVTPIRSGYRDLGGSKMIRYVTE